MNRVWWTDLGRMSYAPVWALQRALAAERKGGHGVDRLLLVEHDPVITLGRRADEAHLLAGRDDLARRGVAVHAVERGGDVTYHGPGQLVAYPVLDLRAHRRDVRWYATSLLESLLLTLRAFGVVAHAREGRETGVWVSSPHAPPAKVAALGVRIERWITYHGVALNVDPDLTQFRLIVPCGLHGVPVTSMARLLGRPIALAEVRPAWLDAFGTVFGVELREAPRSDLSTMVGETPDAAAAPAAIRAGAISKALGGLP